MIQWLKERYIGGPSSAWYQKRAIDTPQNPLAWVCKENTHRPVVIWLSTAAEVEKQAVRWSQNNWPKLLYAHENHRLVLQQTVATAWNQQQANILLLSRSAAKGSPAYYQRYDTRPDLSQIWFVMGVDQESCTCQNTRYLPRKLFVPVYVLCLYQINRACFLPPATSCSYPVALFRAKRWIIAYLLQQQQANRSASCLHVVPAYPPYWHGLFRQALNTLLDENKVRLTRAQQLQLVLFG